MPSKACVVCISEAATNNVIDFGPRKPGSTAKMSVVFTSRLPYSTTIHVRNIPSFIDVDPREFLLAPLSKVTVTVLWTPHEARLSILNEFLAVESQRFTSRVPLIGLSIHRENKNFYAENNAALYQAISTRPERVMFKSPLNVVQRPASTFLSRVVDVPSNVDIASVMSERSLYNSLMDQATAHINFLGNSFLHSAYIATYECFSNEFLAKDLPPLLSTISADYAVTIPRLRKKIPFKGTVCASTDQECVAMFMTMLVTIDPAVLRLALMSVYAKCPAIADMLGLERVGISETLQTQYQDEIVRRVLFPRKSVLTTRPLSATDEAAMREHNSAFFLKVLCIVDVSFRIYKLCGISRPFRRPIEAINTRASKTLFLRNESQSIGESLCAFYAAVGTLGTIYATLLRLGFEFVADRPHLLRQSVPVLSVDLVSNFRGLFPHCLLAISHESEYTAEGLALPTRGYGDILDNLHRLLTFLDNHLALNTGRSNADTKLEILSLVRERQIAALILSEKLLFSCMNSTSSLSLLRMGCRQIYARIRSEMTARMNPIVTVLERMRRHLGIVSVDDVLTHDDVLSMVLKSTSHFGPRESRGAGPSTGAAESLSEHNALVNTILEKSDPLYRLQEHLNSFNFAAFLAEALNQIALLHGMDLTNVYFDERNCLTDGQMLLMICRVILPTGCHVLVGSDLWGWTPGAERSRAAQSFAGTLSASIPAPPADLTQSARILATDFPVLGSATNKDLRIAAAGSAVRASGFLEDSSLHSPQGDLASTLRNNDSAAHDKLSDISPGVDLHGTGNFNLSALSNSQVYYAEELSPRDVLSDLVSESNGGASAFARSYGEPSMRSLLYTDFPTCHKIFCDVVLNDYAGFFESWDYVLHKEIFSSNYGAIKSLPAFLFHEDPSQKTRYTFSIFDLLTQARNLSAGQYPQQQYDFMQGRVGDRSSFTLAYYMNLLFTTALISNDYCVPQDVLLRRSVIDPDEKLYRDGLCSYAKDMERYKLRTNVEGKILRIQAMARGRMARALVQELRFAVSAIQAAWRRYWFGGDTVHVLSSERSCDKILCSFFACRKGSDSALFSTARHQITTETLMRSSAGMRILGAVTILQRTYRCHRAMPSVTAVSLGLTCGLYILGHYDRCLATWRIHQAARQRALTCALDYISAGWRGLSDTREQGVSLAGDIAQGHASLYSLMVEMLPARQSVGRRSLFYTRLQAHECRRVDCSDISRSRMLTSGMHTNDTEQTAVGESALLDSAYFGVTDLATNDGGELFPCERVKPVRPQEIASTVHDICMELAGKIDFYRRITACTMGWRVRAQRRLLARLLESPGRLFGRVLPVARSVNTLMPYSAYQSTSIYNDSITLLYTATLFIQSSTRAWLGFVRYKILQRVLSGATSERTTCKNNLHPLTAKGIVQQAYAENTRTVASFVHRVSMLMDALYTSSVAIQATARMHSVTRRITRIKTIVSEALTISGCSDTQPTCLCCNILTRHAVSMISAHHFQSLEAENTLASTLSRQLTGSAQVIQRIYRRNLKAHMLLMFCDIWQHTGNDTFAFASMLAKGTPHRSERSNTAVLEDFTRIIETIQSKVQVLQRFGRGFIARNSRHIMSTVIVQALAHTGASDARTRTLLLKHMHSVLHSLVGKRRKAANIHMCENMMAIFVDSATLIQSFARSLSAGNTKASLASAGLLPLYSLYCAKAGGQAACKVAYGFIEAIRVSTTVIQRSITKRNLLLVRESAHRAIAASVMQGISPTQIKSITTLVLQLAYLHNLSASEVMTLSRLLALRYNRAALLIQGAFHAALHVRALRALCTNLACDNALAATIANHISTTKLNGVSLTQAIKQYSRNVTHLAVRIQALYRKIRATIMSRARMQSALCLQKAFRCAHSSLIRQLTSVPEDVTTLSLDLLATHSRMHAPSMTTLVEKTRQIAASSLLLTSTAKAYLTRTSLAVLRKCIAKDGYKLSKTILSAFARESMNLSKALLSPSKSEVFCAHIHSAVTKVQAHSRGATCRKRLARFSSSSQSDSCAMPFDRWFIRYIPHHVDLTSEESVHEAYSLFDRAATRLQAVSRGLIQRKAIEVYLNITATNLSEPRDISRILRPPVAAFITVPKIIAASAGILKNICLLQSASRGVVTRVILSLIHNDERLMQFITAISQRCGLGTIDAQSCCIIKEIVCDKLYKTPNLTVSSLLGEITNALKAVLGIQHAFRRNICGRNVKFLETLAVYPQYLSAEQIAICATSRGQLRQIIRDIDSNAIVLQRAIRGFLARRALSIAHSYGFSDANLLGVVLRTSSTTLATSQGALLPSHVQSAYLQLCAAASLVQRSARHHQLGRRMRRADKFGIMFFTRADLQNDAAFTARAREIHHAATVIAESLQRDRMQKHYMTVSSDFLVRALIIERANVLARIPERDSDANMLLSGHGGQGAPDLTRTRLSMIARGEQVSFLSDISEGLDSASRKRTQRFVASTLQKDLRTLASGVMHDMSDLSINGSSFVVSPISMSPSLGRNSALSASIISDAARDVLSASVALQSNMRSYLVQKNVSIVWQLQQKSFSGAVLVGALSILEMRSYGYTRLTLTRNLLLAIEMLRVSIVKLQSHARRMHVHYCMEDLLRPAGQQATTDPLIRLAILKGFMRSDAIILNRREADTLWRRITCSAVAVQARIRGALVQKRLTHLSSIHARPAATSLVLILTHKAAFDRYCLLFRSSIILQQHSRSMLTRQSLAFALEYGVQVYIPPSLYTCPTKTRALSHIIFHSVGQILASSRAFLVRQSIEFAKRRLKTIHFDVVPGLFDARSRCQAMRLINLFVTNVTRIQVLAKAHLVQRSIEYATDAGTLMYIPQDLPYTHFGQIRELSVLLVRTAETIQSAYAGYRIRSLITEVNTVLRAEYGLYYTRLPFGESRGVESLPDRLRSIIYFFVMRNLNISRLITSVLRRHNLLHEGSVQSLVGSVTESVLLRSKPQATVSSLVKDKMISMREKIVCIQAHIRRFSVHEVVTTYKKLSLPIRFDHDRRRIVPVDADALVLAARLLQHTGRLANIACVLRQPNVRLVLMFQTAWARQTPLRAARYTLAGDSRFEDTYKTVRALEWSVAMQAVSGVFEGLCKSNVAPSATTRSITCVSRYAKAEAKLLYNVRIVRDALACHAYRAAVHDLQCYINAHRQRFNIRSAMQFMSCPLTSLKMLREASANVHRYVAACTIQSATRGFCVRFASASAKARSGLDLRDISFQTQVIREAIFEAEGALQKHPHRTVGKQIVVHKSILVKAEYVDRNPRSVVKLDRISLLYPPAIDRIYSPDLCLTLAAVIKTSYKQKIIERYEVLKSGVRLLHSILAYENSKCLPEVLASTDLSKQKGASERRLPLQSIPDVLIEAIHYNKDDVEICLLMARLLKLLIQKTGGKVVKLYSNLERVKKLATHFVATNTEGTATIPVTSTNDLASNLRICQTLLAVK